MPLINLDELFAERHAVKYFEIVGQVVEQGLSSLATLRGIARAEADAKWNEYMEINSKAYRNRSQANLNYRDPLCRLAYLYMYAPAHANLIQLAFEQNPQLRNLVESKMSANGTVTVCVFGGGPGPELLGLAKWVEHGNFPNQVCFDFLLLDQVTEWLDTWQALQRHLESRFAQFFTSNRSLWPLIYSKGFCDIDVTDLSRFGNLGTVFGQDLYIFSYVLSELFD